MELAWEQWWSLFFGWRRTEKKEERVLGSSVEKKEESVFANGSGSECRLTAMASLLVDVWGRHGQTNAGDAAAVLRGRVLRPERSARLLRRGRVEGRLAALGAWRVGGGGHGRSTEERPSSSSRTDWLS